MQKAYDKQLYLPQRQQFIINGLSYTTTMNERLPYLRPHKQLLLDLKLTATTQVKVILRSYPQVSLKDFQVYLDRNNGERRMKWR